MRPLLATALCVVILGGLCLYMLARPERPVAASATELAAAGRFQIEVTLTFDAGPDAFALDASAPPSLLVQFRGRTLYREVQPVPAGQPVLFDVGAPIVEGGNEIYVRATPRDESLLIVRAARVRVLRDQQVLTEKWLSSDTDVLSDPGAPVEGVVHLEVPPAQAGSRK